LRRGTNRLRIRVESACWLPESRPDPYAGPDRAPVAPGIWQDIGLHTWTAARLAEVRPQVTVENGAGCVAVHVTLERDRPGPVTLAAAAGGRESVARITGDRAVLAVTVEDPELWWPRGYGDQPRYDLDVTLSDSYATLDVWSRRIGFRTVRIDHTDGAVVVNDIPVSVRGADWLPDDVAAPRATPERLTERLGQARDANVNFLQVRGGGRYESEDFYDLTDQLGLLVSQDLPFARSGGGEEEPPCREIAAEAWENVVRLSSHPSLILWAGGGYHFDPSEADPTRPHSAVPPDGSHLRGRARCR
jgi:beta-mannosidase